MAAVDRQDPPSAGIHGLMYTALVIICLACIVVGFVAHIFFRRAIDKYVKDRDKEINRELPTFKPEDELE